MAMSTDIKSAEVNADILTSTSQGIHCQICLNNVSKYTCPRCNAAYCSVSCYKDEKHVGCSEAFYKDCVITELQDMTNSESDKKKVLEMLNRDLEDRTEDDGVHDEDEQQSLSERLEGLDLDKDVSAVWGQLSSKEKEEFARMLQDGRLAKLIELWTPWWKCPENLKLVKDNDRKPTSNMELTNMPEILTDIPDINDLLKSHRPSSDCRFDLINILFAYAFVARMHNGDLHECPVDSSQLLLDSSIVLRGQGRCGSVGEAIQLSLDAVDKNSKQEVKSDPINQFSLTVLEEVIALLSGPGKSSHNLAFMLAAISDIISLLRKSLSIVRKDLKDTKDRNDDLKQLKSSIFKAEKKSVFFLSWIQRYGMATHQLIPLLQLEIERRQSDVQELGELKDCLEKNMQHLKPLAKEHGDKNSSNCGGRIVEL